MKARRKGKCGGCHREQKVGPDSTRRKYKACSDCFSQWLLILFRVFFSVLEKKTLDPGNKLFAPAFYRGIDSHSFRGMHP